MTTASPGLVQVCRHCRQPIAWSLSLYVWLHEETSEQDCGPVEVRG